MGTIDCSLSTPGSVLGFWGEGQCDFVEGDVDIDFEKINRLWKICMTIIVVINVLPGNPGHQELDGWLWIKSWSNIIFS